MPSERWKDVVGYVGLYLVSDHGRVRSFRRPGNPKDRILRPTPQKQGYLRVSLFGRGKTRHSMVHRLVLEAFVGPPPTNRECNHRDGIKTNNSSENLEWVTASENSRHAFATGLSVPVRGAGHGHSA